MATENLTCINCPLGCELIVTLEGGTVTDVAGNQCLRGRAYAEMECTNPTRMMCTTVALAGGTVARAPVKTRSPVPKDMVMPCSRALADVTLAAPVVLGQVVLADACATGVDIVATRTIPAGECANFDRQDFGGK